MAGNKDWRKMSEAQKMSSEDVKTAGVESTGRSRGHKPGRVLHQKLKLPFSFTTITFAGFLLTAAVGYFTLYVKEKPEASAVDIAEITTEVATPE